MEGAINYGLGCLGLKDDWDIIPVPAATLPRKAWSARKEKWIPAGPKVRVRMCDKPAVPFGQPTGPVLLEVASDLPPLMLTHGVSLAKMREVRKCNGLLWPSWALSWRLPPTYGDVVFFASVTAVTDVLKPSGGFDPAMYLAGTDIWSPDARELSRLEKAMEWELRGDVKWWDGDRELEDGGWGRRGLQNKLMAEGLGRDSIVGAHSYFDNWEITDRLKTRRQLVARMRALFSAYADPEDPYLYPERDIEMRIGDFPYPYGELKVMGRVELGDIPLVVYPRRIRRSVEKTLDDLGFDGVRLPLTYDGPLHADADDDERRRYAALVTSSVLSWAQHPCHTRGAVVGESFQRPESFRSTYSPTALWIVGRQPWWGPGFCGGSDPGERRTSRMSTQARAWLADKQAQPSKWGLELADAVAEIDDPDVSAWMAAAEQSRFYLTSEDAKVANRFGWFRGEVVPHQEVIVIRADTPWPTLT